MQWYTVIIHYYEDIHSDVEPLCMHAYSYVQYMATQYTYTFGVIIQIHDGTLSFSISKAVHSGTLSPFSYICTVPRVYNNRVFSMVNNREERVAISLYQK